MWDAYVEAAKEAFGDTIRITIDRFHVMKNFQECLTGARRDLQRTLSEDAKAKPGPQQSGQVKNEAEQSGAEDEHQPIGEADAEDRLARLAE